MGPSHKSTTISIRLRLTRGPLTVLRVVIRHRRCDTQKLVHLTPIRVTPVTSLHRHTTNQRNGKPGYRRVSSQPHYTGVPYTFTGRRGERGTSSSPFSSLSGPRSRPVSENIKPENLIVVDVRTLTPPTSVRAPLDTSTNRHP